MLSVAIKSGECVVEVKATHNQQFTVKIVTTNTNHKIIGDEFTLDRDNGDYIHAVTEIESISPEVKTTCTKLSIYLFVVMSKKNKETPPKKLIVLHEEEDGGLVSKFSAVLENDAFPIQPLIEEESC